MNAAGRNDPCPCGSGKKYKKCHLLLEGAAQTQRDPLYQSFQTMRNAADENTMRALRSLLPAGEMERFVKAYESPPFLTPEQAKRLQTNPEAGKHIEGQIPFALLRAYRSPEGKSLAALALEQHHSRFSPDQKNYLRSLEEAPVTFVQAREFFPEDGTVLAEDILDPEIYRIHDYSLSRHPAPHVILAGRLLRYPYGQGFVLDPLGETAYPPADKGDLIAALAAMAGNKDLRGKALKEALRRNPLICYWASQWKYHRWLETPPPDLRNRDGDPILFIEETWTVEEPENALAVIRTWRNMEEEESEEGRRFTWVGEESTLLGQVTLNLKTGLLKISVNSKNRYRRLRRKMDKIPGLSLQGRKETVPDFQNLGKGNLGKGKEDSQALGRTKSANPELPPEAYEQMGRQFFEQWMTNTLDAPIPVLGNLSPREGCRTPEGRKQVRDWVDDFESHLAQNPEDPLMRYFDMDEVRKRLGLASESNGSAGPSQTT